MNKYSYHQIHFDNKEQWRVILLGENGKIKFSKTFLTEQECKEYIRKQDGK